MFFVGIVSTLYFFSLRKIKMFINPTNTSMRSVDLRKHPKDYQSGTHPFFSNANKKKILKLANIEADRAELVDITFVDKDILMDMKEIFEIQLGRRVPIANRFSVHPSSTDLPMFVRGELNGATRQTKADVLQKLNSALLQRIKTIIKREKYNQDFYEVLASSSNNGSVPGKFRAPVAYPKHMLNEEVARKKSILNTRRSNPFF
mgnify:CR=1 FL=1